MQLVRRLNFKLLTVLTLPLVASAARAGFDGWYIVSKVQGSAFSRQLLRVHGHKKWSTWRPAKVGDKIDPPSEVRTMSRSSVSLQSGSQVRYPSKMRLDERVDTANLGPNTLIRTNAQRLGGPKIFIVVRGHVTRNSEQGKLQTSSN